MSEEPLTKFLERECVEDRGFELWDAENASLVGSFETQAAALAVVRRSVAVFGPNSVESLVLTEERSNDADPRVIAAGAELAELAREKETALAAENRFS